MESEVLTHLRRIEQALASDSTRQLLEDIMQEQSRLWSDQAALRDELNASVTALSNRIEGATRADT